MLIRLIDKLSFILRVVRKPTPKEARKQLMDDELKQRSDARKVTIATQEVEERQQCYDGLQLCFSLLTEELKATNAEYAARMVKLEAEMAEAKSQLEVSKAALLDLQRMSDAV